MEGNRKLWLYLVLAGVCIGCGTLKSDQRSQKRQVDERVSALREIQISTSRVLALQSTDSVGNAYQTEIWPEGVFEFKPETGFLGKASKLKQSGQYNATRKVEVGETIQARSGQSDQSTRSTLQKEQFMQKNRISPASGWGWILIPLGIGLLYFWYRKRKHFFEN